MKDSRKTIQRRWPQTLLLALLIGVAAFNYGEAAKQPASAFALADDCPRGALVYAQFADLPALVKQWEASELKRQYLQSTSFQQFANRHLALKLLARWEEFNAALGFQLGADVLSAAADNRAAVAIYDIGRLELVFIAPLSEAKFAAAQFFQNKARYQQQELPDGTVYYLQEVEADRGRQKQQLAFAALRGRFVLATSEKLLLRAMAIISAKANPDRLSADAAFRALKDETTPHSITVWLNQAELNNDYYFRRYWLRQNADEFGALRAGMLDFEMQAGRWIERRNFLLTGGNTQKRVELQRAETQRLASFIPPDTPYFKLRALAEAQEAARLLREVLPGRGRQTKRAARGWHWQYYDESDFECESAAAERRYGESYAYLNRDYELAINEESNADEQADARLSNELERQAWASLRQALTAARPLLAANIESQRALAGPLFAEASSALIVSLAAPAVFNQAAFEQALARSAASRMLLAGSNLSSAWHSHDANGQPWRELNLPLAAWRLCYALRGRELIVANSAGLLVDMLNQAQQRLTPSLEVTSPFSELTIIRLAARQPAFDQVVEKLDAQRAKAYWRVRQGENSAVAQPSQEFFSGNLASLFRVAAPISTVRIERNWEPRRLRETISFELN